jgi:isoleucyl-tRNA synthetase
VARKASLTVIDYLFRCIVTWLAPILSFTAEEAWQSRNGNDAPSVHLELFQNVMAAWRNDALAKKWETIRTVRSVVTGALEIERAAKRIGSSLEASPMVYVSDLETLGILADIDLAEVCITSNAMITNNDAPADAFRLSDVPGVAVVVEKAIGTKCARSWKILPTVGEDPEYPDVSPRDALALREWKALGRSAY